MKQFILSMAIVLSVGAILIYNGLDERVREVNSSISSPPYEPAAQSAEPPLLVPAGLGELFNKELSTATREAGVLPAELEVMFDAKFEEDGYIVEIYREYEIYRDRNGKIIKEVPTANFEFIRYKE
ncbi:hypothetical protein V1502_10550 [Bacillus sp. SCS-153A]|uniref:hypothetical protein n=1 Tax=Rossellomorea sedimentorum TaxID=3115294 RepID=UPI003905BA85